MNLPPLPKHCVYLGLDSGTGQYYEGVEGPRTEAYYDEDQVRQAQREAVAAADLMPELKAMYKAYVRLLETARDRLSDLGYQCDSLEKMERDDPYLIACRKAIAAAPGIEP